MSNWAPIVFGRTYEVDFRFIATPRDFTAQEQTWAEKHILVTTRSAEKLREEPLRWSVFKNEGICLIGVTCMASALSENMTQDSKQRQLYIFVGYVSRNPSAGFPPMDIKLFKPNYKYVRQKWNEQPYNKFRNEPIRTEYNEHLPEIGKASNIDEEYFCLNQTNSQIVRVWPDNERNRQHLWQVASQVQSVSLCLGLASKKDALLNASPFLNITASDVLQKDDLSNQNTRIQLPPIPDGPTENPHEPMTQKSRFFPILMATILGGLIGAFIALSWAFTASGYCHFDQKTPRAESNSRRNSPPTHKNSQTRGAESNPNSPTTPSPTPPEKFNFDPIRTIPQILKPRK